MAGQGFSADQWCNLKAELQLAFDWMDIVKQDVFDPYKEVYNRAAGKEQVDLESIADTIKESLKPNKDEQVLFDIWSVISEVLNLASFFPEADVVAAALDSVQSAYDVASGFATDGDQSPTGDAIDAEAKDLGNEIATQYSDMAAAMDTERDIVISDYGRLSALGPVGAGPRWAIDSGDIQDLVNTVGRGASRSFANALFAIAWHGYALQATKFDPSPTFDGCEPGLGPEPGSIWTPFAGEPPTGALSINGQLVALGHGDPAISAGIDADWTQPPATLLNSLFADPNQGGLGLYAPWLYLRHLTPFTNVPCTPFS